MHSALLRTNAARIRLFATARRKSGYLSYEVVCDVNDCAPLRGGGSADPAARASLYYCTAWVFGYATYRFVSVRRSLILIIRRS